MLIDVHAYLFPQSYAPWLASRLTGSRPETSATCNSCAMVNPQGITRDKGPFLNHLKCCTYFPYLPNFSLGALREEKIQATLPRGVLLPVGLFPSPGQQNLIEHFGSAGFGQKVELLCPFFNSSQNQCSIWDQRPGVCTSYFCKSDQGKKGLLFWSDVEKYLNHFEWKLACEVIFQMGLTENELAYCQGAIDTDTEEDEQEYFIQAAWGPWANNKFKFYQQANKIALSISPEKIGEILDPEFLDLEKKISI